MNWEHTGVDRRGPRDVYLDGHLIADVLAASPSAGMVKVTVRNDDGRVCLSGMSVAFKIMHGHVHVVFRK